LGRNKERPKEIKKNIDYRPLPIASCQKKTRKKDTEPLGGGFPVVAKESDVPPAENATHKESDASALAFASASSALTTSPPAEDDAEEVELLERMRGDAVGDMMFSSQFILQTVLKLVELQSKSSLEQVWDMSVSPEVVTLLLENEAINPIMYSLAGCKDVDWYVGIAVFENSAQNLGRILQQSVSDELLIAALKATNAGRRVKGEMKGERRVKKFGNLPIKVAKSP